MTSGPTFDFWVRTGYKFLFLETFFNFCRQLICVSLLMTLHYNFPYGAVASSVLALIGLEDIMSEYFGDSRIAFYIILNVWIADQVKNTNLFINSYADGWSLCRVQSN